MFLYTSVWGSGNLGGGPTSTWSYSELLESTTSLSTHTLSDVAIGTPAAGRVVVVVVNWGRATTAASLSSLSIGGVSASAVQTRNAGSFACCGIYYAVVPSGSTAEVVITFSLPVNNLAVNVFYGYPATSAPLDSGVSSVSGGGLITISDLETAVGGILIASRTGGSGSPASFGWSGADGITTHGDQATGLTNWTVISIATTAATSGDDLTCDPSGSSLNGLAAATWGGA